MCPSLSLFIFLYTCTHIYTYIHMYICKAPPQAAPAASELPCNSSLAPVPDYAVTVPAVEQQLRATPAERLSALP